MQLQSSLFVPTVLQLSQLGYPTMAERPGIGGTGNPTGGIGSMWQVLHEEWHAMVNIDRSYRHIFRYSKMEFKLWRNSHLHTRSISLHPQEHYNSSKLGHKLTFP